MQILNSQEINLQYFMIQFAGLFVLYRRDRSGCGLFPGGFIHSPQGVIIIWVLVLIIPLSLPRIVLTRNGLANEFSIPEKAGLKMLKNYSLYMLGVSLSLGLLAGMAFPYLLETLVEVPEESMAALRPLAIAATLFLVAAIFAVHYFSTRYVISRFREVLARVRSEDYQARVQISSSDMLGKLTADVNATLAHLEEKNDEVLHDELTGLPNRQFLKQYYRKNLDRLIQHQTAFLFFDLDKFKEINDQHGHLYGDKVLVEVAGRIRTALAEDQVLVRLSGDEFLFVANLSEGCTGQELAEQLLALFFEPFDIDGNLQQVQTSIGVSTAPADGENLAELIRRADFAMYKAKKQEGLSYYLFQKHPEVLTAEMAEPC